MGNNSIKPLKTSIAEDNLIDRKQSEQLLSKSTLPSFEIKHAEYPENASALLNTDIPDLNLPDSSGLDTTGSRCGVTRLSNELKKGMTLVEVMFALFILLIVIIGSSHLFAYGKGQVSLRENYRSALELACQKLEQIKADDYDNIQQGETNENLSLGSLPCTLSTQVQDSNSYKNITTIVCWTQMGKQHDVSLVTSIAPE